jgi:hypothetical protein
VATLKREENSSSKKFVLKAILSFPMKREPERKPE